jgi:ABC-type antimicrobial peptide transport system permease subunit
LLAGFSMTRLVDGFLFGVAPSDPGTMAAAAGLLAVVAALASFLPARAATRIAPLEAMRAE